MSSSDEKSRFTWRVRTAAPSTPDMRAGAQARRQATCTVQVRNIMSSPMLPTLGMYSRMIL
jgi:hypothetical protein